MLRHKLTCRRIPETLPEDVLEKMHAKGLKDADVPVLESPEQLKEYDGFLFGVPTRYGNFPAQWKVRAGRQKPPRPELLCVYILRAVNRKFQFSD